MQQVVHLNQSQPSQANSLRAELQKPFGSELVEFIVIMVVQGDAVPTRKVSKFQRPGLQSQNDFAPEPLLRVEMKGASKRQLAASEASGVPIKGIEILIENSLMVTKR